MKLALGQIDTTVGDLTGNLARMKTVVEEAIWAHADLVVFPELAVCGYPPQDLLDRPDFAERCRRRLDDWLLALPASAPPIVVGSVEVNSSSRGRPLFNAAVFANEGRVQSIHPKTLLPSYDVFDEDRWFEPLRGGPQLITVAGQRVGLTVCEDIWVGRTPRYDTDPVARCVQAGADLIVNISASPFSIGKDAMRRELLCDLAQNYARPVVYLNSVGGNDALVFDGRSLVIDAAGHVIARGAAFAEETLIVDLDSTTRAIEVPEVPVEAEVRDALVLGIRDYFAEIGVRRAVVGLSGGIDSALTAALAAEALGAGQVVGIAMPSEFSSAHSLTDAQGLADNLGIEFHVVPIQPSLGAMRETLAPLLGPDPWGVTDENLQARLRGMILMGWSNKNGHLVLSTGNKSELAVGYCTLYGDMCGGLAVISDLPKTMVYRVAHWMNRAGEIIPYNTIDKPPSAELRPDQFDAQSLPPYDVLDAVLERYVQDWLEVDAIVADGYDRALVERIVKLVDRAEHKRRQMPVGLRVTAKAFGPGRRLPIAQRWTEERLK